MLTPVVVLLVMTPHNAGHGVVVAGGVPGTAA